MPPQSTSDEGEFELGPALRSNDYCEGYDGRGNPVDPADPSCVARLARTTQGHRVRRWVKVATRGADAGHFYNPNPNLDRPVRPDARHADGTALYVWRPVAGPNFESYLRFLHTGNLAHLRLAERP